MEDSRTYRYTGYFTIDREDIIDYLEDESDIELPADYEPTDDEWQDAASRYLNDPDMGLDDGDYEQIK